MSVGLSLPFCESESCSVVSGSLQTYGLYRLFCPWDSPGKNTGSGLPLPPPGDLPNPGPNPGLLSPALAGEFFTTGATWEVQQIINRDSDFTHLQINALF